MNIEQQTKAKWHTAAPSTIHFTFINGFEFIIMIADVFVVPFWSFKHFFVIIFIRF